MQALLPFPQYSGIGDDDPKNGNSTYNALQVGAEKRFSEWFVFLISYTWEKTIDDAGSMLGGFLGAAGRTAYNDKLAKAVGVQDIPHTLVSSWVYKLPFGSGHSFGNSNPVAKALVSGWQLSATSHVPERVALGQFHWKWHCTRYRWSICRLHPWILRPHSNQWELGEWRCIGSQPCCLPQ